MKTTCTFAQYDYHFSHEGERYGLTTEHRGGKRELLLVRFGETEATLLHSESGAHVTMITTISDATSTFKLMMSIISGRVVPD